MLSVLLLQLPSQRLSQVCFIFLSTVITNSVEAQSGFHTGYMLSNNIGSLGLAAKTQGMHWIYHVSTDGIKSGFKEVAKGAGIWKAAAPIPYKPKVIGRDF